MSERLVEPSTAPGRVVVAGGGPAGLKAAEVAARRGHEVILLEKSKRLGGQVRLAALQPEHSSVGEVTSYLEAAVADLKVDVRLGTEATAEAIVGLKPDTVIVATGSEPNLPRTPDEAVARSRALGRQVLPEIEGLDRPFVVSSDEVLSGAANAFRPCRGHRQQRPLGGRRNSRIPGRRGMSRDGYRLSCPGGREHRGRGAHPVPSPRRHQGDKAPAGDATRRCRKGLRTGSRPCSATPTPSAGRGTS